MRQRENYVCVCSGQQLFGSGVHPAVPGIGLTTWTMPVSARVIRDGPVTAGGAFIEVSAQSGRAAALDGSEHFQMEAIEPVPVTFDELATCTTNYIGHLQRWPAGIHRCRSLSGLLFA